MNLLLVIFQRELAAVKQLPPAPCQFDCCIVTRHHGLDHVLVSLHRDLTGHGTGIIHPCTVSIAPGACRLSTVLS